jgi:arabinose-5-phosphate isomerase
LTRQQAVERGRRVLRLETEALAEAERRLGDSFGDAVELLRGCQGRVIVSGMGKSGHIARKIAATLTSTGTPSTFLHPAESLHGDLGIVGKGDVALLISKSGESDELIHMLDHLTRLGVSTIVISATHASTLGRHADVWLDGWVSEEACPHDLAPTTSTTVALALGDALAIALLEAKGFRAEDFALLHPGGTLGRRLLMRVSELMETRDLPVLTSDARMREAIVLLAERRGIVVVCDSGRKVEGVYTAGDLTRLMERNENVFTVRIGDVMNRTPKVARIDELASAVVFRMEQHGIMAMPVLDGDDQLSGVVHLHDLMRAGVA